MSIRQTVFTAAFVKLATFLHNMIFGLYWNYMSNGQLDNEELLTENIFVSS